MAKPQGLQKKGNTYYIRKRVPKDLLDIYKTNEIIRTLETVDYSDAVARLHHEQAKIQSEFKEHRAKIQAQNDNPDMLSDYANYQLEGLAIRWFSDQAKKKNQAHNISDLTDTEKQDIENNLALEHHSALDEVKGLSKDEVHYGLTAASKYLQKREITFNPTSDNFIHRLCR